MEPDKTTENTLQKSQLNKQLVQQLVNLFKQPKIQVKYGSLNAILQYAKTEKDKGLFFGTDLFAEMSKVLNNQKLTKICLSSLINFSSCQLLQKQFVRFVEPLIFNLKEWKDDLRQQLALLVLLNITKFDCVNQKLINTGEKRGFMAEVLYGFMEIKQSRRWVIINIFVNVSSNDYGRRFIAEEKLSTRFIGFINDEKEAVRIGVLKLMRNLSFEWEVEEFIVEILKPKLDLVNKLAEHLAYVIIAGKLSNDQQIKRIIQDYEQDSQKIDKKTNQMKVSSKQKGLTEICLVIDILLVLSNANFVERKVFFKQAPLRQILSILKFTALSEQYKDKIEALQMFCFV